jgi:uncharacterized protein YwqG
MTEQVFRQLCTSHGFDEVASIIQRFSKPCVGFSLHDGRSSDTAASKLGGNPALPISFEWPTYRGRPLDFLLQINLRDLNGHTLAPGLPSEGLLAFFYELEEQPWGYDPENLSFFRVCYFEDVNGLSSQTRPEHRLNSPMLCEKGIDFWSACSLPEHGSRDGNRLLQQIRTPGNDFDFSAFERLSEAAFRADAPTAEGPRHHIGGHSDNIQNDMQLEAQLVMNGLYCGDASGYRDPRRPQLEQSCEQWQLLLQLDSDNAAKLLWGDGGMLYFWIRRADLERNDFSKTWMTLQCG